MTDLIDLAGSYKREVAPPGGFDAAFPGITDSDILGALADGFSEAQLEGFFGTSVLDLDDMAVTPDLSNAGRALVVIYAGMRSVRAQLMATKTSTRYKAGPVEYEVQQGASVLTELLKDLRARRDYLLEAGRRARVGQTTYVFDNYMARVVGEPGGFLSGELPAAIGTL